MTVFDEAWNVLKEDKQHEKKIIECLKKEGGAASLDDCAKECGVSKQECMKVIDKMDNVKVSPHGDVDG
jgi:DNA-binding Lrp family transcriptional regulator